MRDYEKLVKGLRYCFEHDDCGSRCPYFSSTTVCADERAKEAADAIEELLKEKARLENSGKLLVSAFERLKEKAPKWISVEERLPEDGKYVLCWYEYYHWSKEKMLPEYGIGYCINGHWGGEVSNGRDCKVLYWMPLPAPPKEVE